MKKGLKRNHIMIGALALMIAVAGYLNFSAGKADEETLAELSAQETAVYDLTDEELVKGGDLNVKEENEVLSQTIQNEDLLQSENQNALENELDSLDEADAVITSDYITEDAALPENGLENPVDGSEEAVTEEGIPTEGVSVNTASLDEDGLTIDEIPGEAVFTSGNGMTSLASARLLKEQTRAMNRETLLNVINSETADDVSRQQAADEMLALTRQAEKEMAAEILLEAKGYEEAVVSISGDSADVVIGSSSLSKEQCAQIMDAVARKTEIAVEKIVITPAQAQ